MKIITFMIVVILLPFLIGCPGESTTILDPPEVDHRLVGVWTNFNGTTFGNTPVRGIEIGSDKSIRFLSVETATGRLVRMEERFVYDLLSANDDTLIFKQNYCCGTRYFSKYRFRIEGRQLFLSDIGYGRLDSYTYVDWVRGLRDTVMYRTVLGSNVNTPMPLTFSAKINDIVVKNRAVAESPSAGVFRTAPSELYIYAKLEKPWESIYIPIGSFTGPGKYEVIPVDAFLNAWCNSIGYSNFNFDSMSRNTVTIDTFDTTTNRCSGSFELDFKFNTGCVCETHVRLRGGVFSLPIVDRLQLNQVPEQVLKRRATLIQK